MENTQPASVPRPSLTETLQEQRCAMREQLEAAWHLQMARIEQVIEERFQETEARVAEAFSRELEARLSELRPALRRELGDRFNQSLRRLRKSEAETGLYATLLDAAG